MRQSHLRLRSVTPKDGGAHVRVLHNDIPGIVSRDLRDFAGYIAERRAADMAGYVIIAWSNDGSVGTRLFVGNNKAVPRLMIPEFIKACAIDFLASLPDEQPGPVRGDAA